MSNTGWAVVVVVLIIILGGGWWWYSSQGAMAPAPVGTTPVGNVDTAGQAQGDTSVSVSNGAGINAANTTTIHYTASGFSPKSVTIAKGQNVTWINDTTGPMWVASSVHPVHTAYDGTDRTTHCAGSYTGPTPFDECAPGSTYTFVFSKTGTFAFHNHSAAQFEGTVVVK